jgi:hypothetical protein
VPCAARLAVAPRDSLRELRSDSRRGELEDEARKRADRKTALLGAFEGNPRRQPASKGLREAFLSFVPTFRDAVRAFEGGEQASKRTTLERARAAGASPRQPRSEA